MASFNFSMEKILTYRKQLEDKAKTEVGHIQSNLLRAQNKQAIVIQELRMKEDSLLSLLPASSGERYLLENYIRALKTDVLEINNEIRQLDVMLLAAKQKLTLCSKDKMILEKLKEKSEIKFKAEELQREQREYDEIASIRYQAVTC